MSFYKKTPFLELLETPAQRADCQTGPPSNHSNTAAALSQSARDLAAVVDIGAMH